VSNERWEKLRGQMSVDEAEVLAIRRLMQAETALADARTKDPGGSGSGSVFGSVPGSGSGLTDLLDKAQRDPAVRADLYLATLARYAAGRGGHVEVRVVLPDRPVTVLVL
jgi:hypothetical protein